MDPVLALIRLGQSLRRARRRRGLTQVQVAERAALTRHKVMQVEAGQPSVAAFAYARVAAALDQEFAVVPTRRPTLEELQEMDPD